MVLHVIELVREKGVKPFAFHFSTDEMGKIKAKHKEVFKECAGYDISTHVLTTNDNSWKSVYKLDPYFADVMVFADLTKFKKYLKRKTQIK